MTEVLTGPRTEIPEREQLNTVENAQLVVQLRQEQAEREAEEAYKLAMYYEWLNAERAKLAALDPEYLAWCEAAQRAAREQASQATFIHPDYHVSPHATTVQVVTPEDRERAEAEIEAAVRARQFARPVLHAVFSQPHAQFVDDFLRYSQAQTPDEAVLARSYTDKGDLISVKRLFGQDVEAEGSHRVVIGNLEKMTMTEYRVSSIELSPATSLAPLSMMLRLTTDVLDRIDGQPVFDKKDPVKGIYQLEEEVATQHDGHTQQTSIELSTQHIVYQPFNGRERVARQLDRLEYDRYRLARLALVAGWPIAERAAPSLSSTSRQRSIA